MIVMSCVVSHDLHRAYAVELTTQITRGIHTDCLLNYETVKYFGGEAYEGARYAEAIREYQALEYRVISELTYFIPSRNAPRRFFAYRLSVETILNEC